ncbi:FtsX family ABC transporter permease [Rothia sp. HMSC061E04]|uniref:ABC transporter permease n=1 Tax=Rothia sp. HMSC061E04 TaxID=1739431 RepID=UPI0008A629F7|nr:FtsX family ABC transporter permease [Rothia sp. HMSC061E04]OFQ64710.1 ABC transporter permease [Rothia sp. HMSC061E04]
MATTLNTVARSNLRASKGKYILTGIGIAISSFFIAAIMMLTNSLQATVNSSVGDVLSRAEAVVASAATTYDGKDSTAIYLTRDQIQKAEQSDLLSGYWVQYAVTGSIGTGDQKTPVQYNQLPADSSLFPYKVQGKIPSSNHEIMVSTYFAKKHNLSLNGKVTSTDVVESVSAPGTDKTSEYTVVGLFDPGFEGSTTNQAVFIGGTSLGEATLKAAETENKNSAAGYRSMAGANLIYLKFKDGVTDAKLKSLQDTLSSGDTKNDPRVMTGQKLLEDYQKSISTVFTSISVVLGAFAALALLVSSFVISNTFAVLVGQRIRELALLRTLGARGGSLVRMLLIESITVGVVFSLIGALLTFPVGALVGANLTTIMISYSITPILVSVLLCTIVTVLASLSPARSALRISPISAMSEHTNREVSKPGKIGPIIGALFAIGGVVAVVAALDKATSVERDGNSAIFLGMLAALLLGIAVFLITPLVLPPLVRALGAVTRTQTGKLALANALRSPKRTVSTGRAVLVGTLVVSIVLTGYTVLSASFVKALDQQYPISAQANYSSYDQSEAASTVTKAEDIASKVKGIKNVQASAVGYAAGVVDYTVEYEGQTANQNSDLVALSSSDLHAILPDENSNLADDTVLVPQGFWKAAGLNESSRLKARGPLGEVELKPVKSATKQNLLIVNPATAAKLQDAKNPQVVANPAAEEAQKRLEEATASGDQEAQTKAAHLTVTSQARGNNTVILVRAASPLTSSESSTLQTALNRISPENSFNGGLQERQTFDQLLTVMLTFTLVMLMLAVVISIIGVANTMTLSVNERRRENAMLRSLGLSRKQLRRMISIEANLITLAAVVLGMVSGAVIGTVSAKIVMAAVSSSAPLVLDLPYVWYVVILIVGVLAAMLASALPAARSARMSPVEGMRG